MNYNSAEKTSERALEAVKEAARAQEEALKDAQAEMIPFLRARLFTEPESPISEPVEPAAAAPPPAPVLTKKPAPQTPVLPAPAG